LSAQVLDAGSQLTVEVGRKKSALLLDVILTSRLVDASTKVVLY
jgi:hypothetical protein